jgi:hypothetical protein
VAYLKELKSALSGIEFAESSSNIGSLLQKRHVESFLSKSYAKRIVECLKFKFQIRQATNLLTGHYKLRDISSYLGWLTVPSVEGATSKWKQPHI